MTEIVKTNIEAAFGDRVEVGRAQEGTGGNLVYIAANSPGEPPFHIYYSESDKRALDDTIAALMQARRDAFGTRP